MKCQLGDRYWCGARAPTTLQSERFADCSASAILHTGLSVFATAAWHPWPQTRFGFLYKRWPKTVASVFSAETA